jgi:hypothetical protein
MQDLGLRHLLQVKDATMHVLTEGYRAALASSNVGDPISKSYRRFPLDEFELFVNKTEHLTKYIEYESDKSYFPS